MRVVGEESGESGGSNDQVRFALRLLERVIYESKCVEPLATERVRTTHYRRY